MRRQLQCAVVLAISGCAKAPQLEGEVLDVFGDPIEQANVQLENAAEFIETDSSGRFVVVLEEGTSSATTLKVAAGKLGYIEQLRTIDMPQEADGAMPTVTFSLYPDPESTGLFAVGDQSYIQVPSLPIKLMNDELQAYAGIEDQRLSSAQAVVDARRGFVFRTEATQSQLARLKLRLHKLEYKQQTKATGLEGEVDVDIEMWLAQSDVPFDLTVLAPEGHYLISTRETLDSGTYAFHTQEMLSASAHDLIGVPVGLRVAYVFQVN